MDGYTAHALLTPGVHPRHTEVAISSLRPPNYFGFRRADRINQAYLTHYLALRSHLAHQSHTALAAAHDFAAGSTLSGSLPLIICTRPVASH